MQEKKFTKQEIRTIALALLEHEVLYVTTEGCMYVCETTAEHNVKLKNEIVGDPNMAIGVVKLTSDMTSREKLQEYSADTSLFDKLFVGAKVPISKKAKGVDHASNREQPKETNKKAEKEIEELLGMNVSVDSTDKETEESPDKEVEKSPQNGAYANPNTFKETKK